MEQLISVVGHSLHGTGISPERAAELAAGSNPETEHERRVALVLRSGWTSAEKAEELLSEAHQMDIEKDIQG